MKVVEARNVNDALYKGVQLIRVSGKAQESRGGATLEYPTPVCTAYERPLERVLFDPVRDANPYFHLMEALWMLAGRQDVPWLVRFNKRMATYSDGDEIFNAAYGYRWRNEFRPPTAQSEAMERIESTIRSLRSNQSEGSAALVAELEDARKSLGKSIDQLDVIASLLRADRDSRRAVLQIWDAGKDLKGGGVDCACNTQVMFKVRHDELNMLVTNRSNDAIWGCYGANAVQFSMLLEYMAARIGVRPGIYRQMSDSFHAYKDTWEKVSGIVAPAGGDPYSREEVSVYPLVEDPVTFDEELIKWIDSSLPRKGKISEQESSPPDKLAPRLEELSLDEWEQQTALNPYFLHVATPIHNAWFAYKRKDRGAANAWLDRCAATDWQRAAREWLQRRK